MVSKARGAASVEALSIVSEKSIEVRKVRAKTMASEVQFDPTEFDKVSDKSKEVLIDQSEKDIEKYEDRTMLCIREHDIEIKKKLMNYLQHLPLLKKFRNQALKT